MEQGQADQGSPDAPIVFPAIPWLRNGTVYDAYLESAIAHAKNQDAHAGLLPIFLTETIDDDIEITKDNQMDLITPKLNEIIDEFLKTEAEYLWFLNADNEYPSFTLRYLLEHNADLVSAISPTHRNWLWTTSMRWLPAPTPKVMGSLPYFKPYRIDEIEGKIVGRKEMVASGHFCMLVKRYVFDNIRFRWVQHKERRCSNCGTGVKCLRQRYGSEYTFWMDAFMLGYKCRIDGRVVCGHLPEWSLKEYNVVE